MDYHPIQGKVIKIRVPSWFVWKLENRYWLECPLGLNADDTYLPMQVERLTLCEMKNST